MSDRTAVIEECIEMIAMSAADDDNAIYNLGIDHAKQSLIALRDAAAESRPTPGSEHPFTQHELLVLLDECRDAIQPITMVQLRLHNISPTLAKRVDDVIDKANTFNASKKAGTPLLTTRYDIDGEPMEVIAQGPDTKPIRCLDCGADVLVGEPCGRCGLGV